MSCCYHCGKIIRNAQRKIVTKYLDDSGMDYRAYHAGCYALAEKEAEEELQRKTT